MKIAIPSYQRIDTLLNKTLKNLISNDIELNTIYVFVANQEEYDIYLAKLPEGINLIIGEKGMNNIRNFITNFFDDGEIYCSMDDDIEKFKYKNDKTLKDILTDCENELVSSNYQLVGFPPTFNDFFNKGIGFKSGLLLCLGGMFICKNDKMIQVTNFIEDYERTIKSYTKYGSTLRCCNLMIKPNYYANGGMNSADNRKWQGYYNGFVKLYYKYPELILMKSRIIKYLSNEPLPHIKLMNKKEHDYNVLELPPVSKTLFDNLFEILNQTTLRKNKSTIDNDKIIDKLKRQPRRKNFPEYRAETFGLIKRRAFLRERPNTIEISLPSRLRPELYEELKRIGDTICPFRYSSIFLNNNCISPPHKDGNNVGKSLIISIGDYEGCNLVIDGVGYDARYKPIIFNGSQIEHWNTPLISGNKYSLIFYDITPC